MPQPSDIVLNGDSYMLVAATGREGYVRSQDGIDEGRTGRISQTDFFGGLGRALALERDRGWNGVAVGPAHGGQGIQPWPYSETVTLDPATPLATTGDPFPHAVIREYVYFAVGQHLYRTIALTATGWATPTHVFDAGAGNVIHGIAYYGGNILLTFGATREVTHVLYPNATSPAVLFAGEHGYGIVSYQGYAIWADARPVGTGYQNQLRMVTGTGIQFRWVDAPIKRLTTAGPAVVVATDTAIHTYAGRVAEYTVPNPTPPPDNVEVLRWTGDVTPFFQHGTATAPDDFRFILGFGGRTYAWLGGMVLEHDPEGERAGWKDTGLRGVACHGACVAAGYLVVSLISDRAASELWAWDGSGWWCLHRQPFTGANQLLQPIPLAGAGGFDVGVVEAGTRTMRVVRLAWRDIARHAYPATTSTYVTSLIDAGERDKHKAWRKVGAVFASPNLPGNPAGTGPVTVTLRYSVDGGGTWALAASRACPANDHMHNTFAIEAAIASNDAVSSFLQLETSWSGGADWAPVLVGAWAEFETLDSPARRRRWQFTVQAEDQVIDRDGDQLTRSGREQIAELWGHWQAGTTVPFRDIDYDADPAERQVRIVGIQETVPMPYQSGLWGQSAVMLTLVEV